MNDNACKARFQGLDDVIFQWDSDGYIAILQPKKQDEKSALKNLLTSEQYEESIKVKTGIKHQLLSEVIDSPSKRLCS